MNQRPNAAFSSAVKVDGSPNPNANPVRRLLLWAIPSFVLALVCCGIYAIVHPERVPEHIGILVEDLTGANPRPVHLLRPPEAPLSALAVLGKQVFFDQSLSASGKQSCASCHSPDHAYGPANALPVQFGGPQLQDPGYRPPPSLAYLYRQANFSIGPDANEVEVAPDLAALATQAQGVAR